MAIYRQEKDEKGNTLFDSDGNPKMILVRADNPIDVVGAPIEKTDISNIDIDSLTDEQIQKLKVRLKL